jgi:hypothetical protein
MDVQPLCTKEVHIFGRWLPAAAARIRVRPEHVGFVVEKAALGQAFSEYFGLIFLVVLTARNVECVGLYWVTLCTFSGCVFSFNCYFMTLDRIVFSMNC